MTGYHCPMHTEKTRPTPGHCPACRMRLVPDRPERTDRPAGSDADPPRGPHAPDTAACCSGSRR